MHSDGFEQQQRIEYQRRGQVFDEGIWLTNLASHFLRDLMSGVVEERIKQLGAALVPEEEYPPWLKQNRIGEYWRGVRTDY